MKKMLFAIVVLMASSQAKAQDIVTASLIDNVTTVTQFESGKTKLALMSSVIQIGKFSGKSIFDLQAGFNTDVNAGSNEARSAAIIFGGWFKVSSIMNAYVKYPDEWKFLKSLEHGVAVNYNARTSEWRASYQAGLAFSLNPK